jgi:hypothetical protein
LHDAGDVVVELAFVEVALDLELTLSHVYDTSDVEKETVDEEVVALWNQYEKDNGVLDIVSEAVK